MKLVFRSGKDVLFVEREEEMCQGRLYIFGKTLGTESKMIQMRVILEILILTNVLTLPDLLIQSIRSFI